MSRPSERSRRQRALKVYLLRSHYRVEDQLEGAMRLPRGSLCQEQDGKRGDHLWVKVLDTGSLVKMDRQVLVDVPAEWAGLLQAIPDTEARLNLFFKPEHLQNMASLSPGAKLQVLSGQSGELVEGVLRYRGPLTGGSSAIYFGVQLKVPLAGKAGSNGSYKGHQLFVCPEGCGIFVSASQISLRSPRSRSVDPDVPAERDIILPRTTTSAPDPASTPLPLQVGQRVCFFMDDTPEWGEVCFCGLLPGKSQLGLFVGLKLDRPVGSWDGIFKDDRLCSIPSPQYGLLLPLAKISSAPHQPAKDRSARRTTTHIPVPIPKTPQSPRSPTTAKPQIPHSTSPPDSSSRSLRMLVPPLSPNKSTAEPCGDPEKADVTVGQGAEFEVGSMVEVNDPPLYGVIRWIGEIDGVPDLVAGLELDHELTAATDGSYLGIRYFRCSPNRALFVKLRNCRRDSRFPVPEMPANQVERCNSIAFAEWGSERVEEHTPAVYGEGALEHYSGWKKGIQGHLNSCYLDASLFSLFSCSSSADWVLLWPLGIENGVNCCRAQDLLRCEIVNPLRRNGYVCASKTMALRRLLDAEHADSGFTTQEKDPEEFLNRLFQLLQLEPFLKIRSASQEPQECHLYQLFPPPSSSSASSIASVPLSPSGSQRRKLASVQTLLEASFLHAGLKFAEAPSCLLLMMPRFGTVYKMFEAILPSLTLDITDLLDDTLRECSICQSVAEWECPQCYQDVDITPGRLKQYCNTCNIQVHNHRKRLSHKPGKVSVPGGPWAGPVHSARQRLKLFAVTCIETSHYVSFVHYGPLPTDWIFFDSMADRKGGENGFNIPKVTACPEVYDYLGLSEEELISLDPASIRGPARRLLCDSYMCLYHSPELSLYK